MASRLTRVEDSRTIRRLVQPASRHAARPAAPLVVELRPEGLWLREKGRQKGYLLPYGVAYIVGARLEADRLVREKKAARKERAAARRTR